MRIILQLYSSQSSFENPAKKILLSTTGLISSFIHLLIHSFVHDCVCAREQESFNYSKWSSSNPRHLGSTKSKCPFHFFNSSIFFDASMCRKSLPFDGCFFTLRNLKPNVAITIIAIIKYYKIMKKR